MQIEIIKNGNWNKVQRDLGRLPLDIRSSAKWGQTKAGKMLLKKVRGHIMNQDLGWASLAYPGLSRSPQILVDSGNYFASIKMWQKNNSMHVGVPKGITEPRSGIEIARLAFLHEHGTKKMPARPLWGPSIREMGGPKGLALIVQKTIAKKLKRFGYPEFNVTSRS